MTELNPVGQLVAVIRSRLSERTASGRTGRRRAAKSGDTYAQEGLADLIGLRVAQIGLDDPQRGAKAFRIFLDAVLLSHFGSALANDPRFHQMVDDIQRAMDADPATHVLIEEAIAQLLAPQSSGT